MYNFSINRIKHEGREHKGFRLLREKGSGDYIFIHFLSPIDIMINGSFVSCLRNACIIFDPESYQQFYASEEALVHNWIHFMPENKIIFNRMGLPINRVFYPRNTGFITNLVKTMEMEFVNKPPFWEVHADGLLLCLFTLIARETMEVNETRYGFGSELRSSFELLRLDIYNDPGRNWTIPSMASRLGLSRSRFTVLYGKFFKVSPIEDLITARIEYAKHLLIVSDMSISQLAESVGYDSVEHFSRQFKKRTGVTPRSYTE